MLAFYEPYAVSDNAKGDEIILVHGPFHDFDDVAGRQVEGFHRRQRPAVRQRLSLGEHAFRSVLIDIEAEDLAAKVVGDDDAARTDRPGGICLCGHEQPDHAEHDGEGIRR